MNAVQLRKRSAHRKRLIGNGVLAFVLALPLPAWAHQELVVVRKTGQTSTYVSHAKAANAAAAACSDSNVAFAFTVEPRDGQTSIELQRGVDVSRDVVLDVTLTCSSLSGSASIPFDAVGGTASSGTDFISLPGIALLDLSAGQGDGSPAPVQAVVRIDLVGSGQSGTQTLSIVRTEGSFQAILADGSPIVGSIPGSTVPIVSVTILGNATIEDGANVLPVIDPAADEVSTSTTAFCGVGGGGFGTLGCLATQTAADLVVDPSTPAEIREAATTVLENNLLAVSPDETTAMAFVAPIVANGQSANLGGRMAEMRSGDLGGTFSAGGLTMINGGIPISFASLASVLNVDDDESARNEEQRTLLGGTRLGLWLNGTIGGGESDRREGNAGFESDTWNLTGGVDYRFTDRFFAGVALGYSNLEVDYSADQGSLDVDATSLHVYSGYSLPNGFSFDGSVSAMRSDYSQRRVIEILQLNEAGTGFQSLGRDIAKGDTTVSQYGANFGVTYTIMRDTWTIAPQAQLSVLRTTYDAFRETGPSEFNLRYDERSNSSRSLSLGSHFDRTFATSVGAFRPYLRAFYFADSGSSPDLLARFALGDDDGGSTPLSISMQEPDRRYGTAELGLGFSRPIGTRTVDFNVGYMQTFSFDSLDRWALRFDMRLPL